MSESATTRFGWDAPTRVSGTAVMLTEQSAVPPIPLYVPLPFVPATVSGATTETAVTDDGHTLWQRTPARCDLLFYQGDDIVIPLYFNDPEVTGDDMSDQEWHAQIRVRHGYRSTLISEFSIAASYHAGVTEDSEYTVVEMFLPRSDNTNWGTFHWDLYSISTADLTRFPKPDGVDAADWPPPDAVRTWLFGQANIVPRVTSTDVLVGGSSSTGYPYVPSPGPAERVTVITTGGWCVGPNGRVP